MKDLTYSNQFFLLLSQEDGSKGYWEDLDVICAGEISVQFCMDSSNS